MYFARAKHPGNIPKKVCMCVRVCLSSCMSVCVYVVSYVRSKYYFKLTSFQANSKLFFKYKIKKDFFNTLTNWLLILYWKFGFFDLFVCLLISKISFKSYLCASVFLYVIMCYVAIFFFFYISVLQRIIMT